MTDRSADLDLIISAAQEAGALAERLRRQGLEVDYKGQDRTPVTNADLAADALLRERLTSARPDYGWLSEETVDDPARLAKRRLFVVDPIDGTRAFLNDRPWWAVSIAVVEDHEPVAGVVFAPELGETYAARTGGGAKLNDKAIRPSATDALEGCGMVGDPQLFQHPAWPIPWPPMRVERRNSTALRMCLVAAGAFDAAVAFAKRDWDVAGADVIAREAGCAVGDHLGRTFRYNGEDTLQRTLVCAAPKLSPLILNQVRHIGRGN